MPNTPNLPFSGETFRIVQIADTQDGRRVSPDTLRLMDAALERVKPDLVVFTGDQIWGKRNFHGSTQAVRETLCALLQPVTSRGIPFTVCFGNHDRQTGVSNDEQLRIYKSFPGCVAQESEADTDGTANHCLALTDKTGKPLFLLYLLDSHTNNRLGYDCVHENQLAWYRRTRDAFREQAGSYVPAIVFQHIPLCEVFSLLTQVPEGTKGAVRAFRAHKDEFYVLNRELVNSGGFMKESPADPDENSGELAAFSEKGDVRGVYFGHDHNNSFHGKVGGIDLGYTQGAGFHVYGPGLDRGVRVFEIPKEEPGSYRTYDLRYRELCQKSLSEPLTFAVNQILPTNTFDALHRLKKAALVLGAASAAGMLIHMLKKQK